ncbi:conserved hypothetical protein [Xenorhabdus bovienii str. puntauvense]|uniref:N-acetyltransferase domain-containing protein n=3 Tax=Xenorhabdus bovienii TaxID=40576 RepID=A0A0B6X971_XENBV|nr:GNAT family N-acetyltransferase [Xenorhabdus bovienii]CDG87858.1 conserved hypothetical protein [Xenorhabdus bovienii str. feltiae France]CDG94543.1 conserved hypothetical protein [Xenorhabdus bovienii str. feltiae Florida]CDG97489.1 conserved hypothetical protein [Xenorhabdus bovienii str. puntauvense]CDM89726.1 conserved protein of unknown function [Xenorhabdus bovienii]
MIMPFDNLETERLLLRKLAYDDAPQIQQKFPYWEVVKYLDSNAVPWPYPDNGAEYFVNHIAMPEIQTGKAWIWSIRMKNNPDKLIGMIGLYDKPDNNRGFWLSPEYHGRGLMREASERVTDYWFNELDRTVLRTLKACINENSRKISLIQGMRLISTNKKQYVSGRYDSEMWEITKDEWRNKHPLP